MNNTEEYDEYNEYDEYEQHDPLEAEMETNLCQLKNNTQRESNKLIIQYDLPIEIDMEAYTNKNIDWNKIYYRFNFQEKPINCEHNVYLVDKDGYLHFARNANYCDKETPEDADNEKPSWKYYDLDDSFTDTKEEKFYTGRITATRYFLSNNKNERDLRVDIHLTFKDAKIINVHTDFHYFCNIARFKIADYKKTWEKWEESKAYETLEKFYWKPLDTIQSALETAVKKVSDCLHNIIFKTCNSIRFDKSRYQKHW